MQDRHVYLPVHDDRRLHRTPHHGSTVPDMISAQSFCSPVHLSLRMAASYSVFVGISNLPARLAVRCHALRFRAPAKSRSIERHGGKGVDSNSLASHRPDHGLLPAGRRSPWDSVIAILSFFSRQGPCDVARHPAPDRRLASSPLRIPHDGS